MTEQEGDFQRLAEEALRRRGELGMTQEDVRAAGGPATATVRQIESGRPQAYQSHVRRKFEKAVKWPTGHFDDLLARRERPASDQRIPDRPRNEHEWTDDLPANRATPEEIVIALHRAAQRDRELGREGKLFWAMWDVIGEVNHPREETSSAPTRADRPA